MRDDAEVLAEKRRVFGENHPSTLKSASDMALSLSDQGKYAESAAMLEAVLAIQRVLGSAHPDATATAKNLEVVRSQMRNSASKSAEKAVPMVNLFIRAVIAGVVWWFAYLYIRRLLNPENNGNITKYQMDGIFGGLAAFSSVFITTSISALLIK